ncbi:S8 family serine peptidase [Oceanobacillus chungangensis]|uniref:Peptidase S8 n=1 Tax=Oceanobacillus chungangensis TaxID=1229152 RepID=A0A3D8PWZ2_9BACI|nr:S8 family serine peptidase [Oceanobacillus chungangensis]RDW20544.1 peptidase S8 [Oceanobacillus chungangensis]
MRKLIFLLTVCLAIIFIYFPVSSLASRPLESIIIEVEGDPEEHKDYIEQYHPYVQVIATYEKLFQGLALKGTADKLARMESLTFIKEIHPVQTYTTQEPEILRSPNESLKNLVRPSDLNTTAYTGKGVKVGVIDTGIDYNHADLRNNYQSGYDLVDLDTDPMETNPSEGIPTLHGSHVAGIIAANGSLKGVAPEAEIYAYRALGPGGAGTSVQVIAAMEQAVKDGVDVINLSLGNSVNGPDYPTSTAVNRAVELGIPVVIANGNSGPNNWTVGAPATAERALSVGALANPQQLPFLFETISNKEIPLTEMIESKPWNLEKSYPIVDGQLETAEIRGKIAVFKRGKIPFFQIAKSAEEKGAVAAIIYNNKDEVFQGSIESREGAITIPVAAISKRDGEWLMQQLEGKNHYYETVYKETESTIAPFSSRGPVTINWDIKPDILAPGTNILSTVPGGYQALQGTSMAAPHVTGVIALIKEAHPNWTVGQIFDAIRTTAIPITKEGKLLDPIEQGMGSIRPLDAINTPLIIHHSQLAFGKIEGYYESKTLEIEIENTTNEQQAYTFDIPKKGKGLTWKLPQRFTVNKHESKTIPIELKITTPQLAEGIHQGWLTLNQDDDVYLLPYLFINQTADNPKAMGFEFSLKPFSEDSYQYNLYLTEQVERIEVDLYTPDTLLFNRSLLEVDNLQIGMNTGEIKKGDIGKPGHYVAIITTVLEDGSYESHEVPLTIE